MGWEETTTGFFELINMKGGLNANGEDVADDQSMKCKNVYWKDAALRKMYGGGLYVSDPVVEGSPVSGIYQFRTDAGGNYIVATCSNTIKKLSGSSWIDITGGTTITSGYKTSFATYMNTLIGTNGVDAVWAWSGSGNAAALGGSPPIGKYVTSYRGYLVLGNCTVAATPYPQRAYRSGLFSSTSWNTTDDYWNFGTRTASPLTGLLAQQSRLCGLKNDSLGIVVGASPATFSLFPEAYPGIGCVSGYALGEGRFNFSGQSIVGAIFPGIDGLYLIPEGGSPSLVTPNIAPHYRQLDATNLDNSVGAYYSSMKQYLSFMPSGLGSSSNNDAGYLLDTQDGGAWPLSNFNATCCTTIKDPSDDQEYVLVGLSNGRVLKLDPPIPEVSYGTFNINGDSIPNDWTSNWFNLGSSDNVKLLRELLFAIGAVGNNSLSVQVELRNSQRTLVFNGTVTPGDSAGQYDFAYGVPYARAGLQLVGLDAGSGANIKDRAFRDARITISQFGDWGWAMRRVGIRPIDLGRRRAA